MADDPDAPEEAGSAGLLERVRRSARVDLAASSPPAAPRVAWATLGALAGSLALDEGVVHLATAVFPSARHFSHFRFSDYATLTVVGVLLGCAAWPLVTRVTSAPRWLFFRLAVGATVLLWLPDGWLLLKGETGAGVAALMVLHLGIAVITYNLLVHLAPAGPPRAAPGSVAPRLSEAVVRRVWSSMALVVAVELVLGVASIVTVPFRRPDAVLPSRGVWIYAAHGAVGVVLGVGALALLVLAQLANRMARIGAVMGAVGTAVGLAGGILATFQSTRLLGMGVMMVGVVVAGIGYLVPTLEAMGKAEAARAEAARAELARAEAERKGASRTNGKGG